MIISSSPPGPPRCCPSPPLSGRNSWRRKCRGKRTSCTSMLPNLMPPAACHSPAPGQPSPADEPPPPGRAWNRCQMNGLLGARVDALNGHPEATAPARHRPLGACRRKRADDRLDDLLGAVIGAQRHRGTGPRPDNGALLELQLQRPEGAVVLGDFRIDEIGERHHGRGIRVGIRGVDEAPHLGMAVGEIDVEIATLLGDTGADMDVAGLRGHRRRETPRPRRRRPSIRQ